MLASDIFGFLPKVHSYTGTRSSLRGQELGQGHPWAVRPGSNSQGPFHDLSRRKADKAVGHPQTSHFSVEKEGLKPGEDVNLWVGLTE